MERVHGEGVLRGGQAPLLLKKHGAIPCLGLVDNLSTISTCGVNTTKMNKFINTKTALKRLQFGTSKCVKLHVGKTCNKSPCQDLYVDGWKVDSATDSEEKYVKTEYYGGPEKMKEKLEQTYLGDVISADGSHTKMF